ncbi:MAG TPA: Uma2 family endonuclease [Polyangiaceae bacterium]|nr:Uma2 family endonuclease [Polyangiaceae bacterium]
MATGLATYPDATVVGGTLETDRDDRNAAINPKVVVEVPREGTEEYDREEELRHYQRVPSLEAVVIVSQTQRHIELWQRPCSARCLPTVRRSRLASPRSP